MATVTKVTLRAFIYLDPGKMKDSKGQWEVVCCTKNEKTAKEGCNNTDKISMHEIREQNEMEGNAFN